MATVAGVETDLTRGLAGSNTMHWKPAVRIACSTDTWNEKTKHAVVKRLGEPHGGRKTQLYTTDNDLMRRLNLYASDHDYPDPEGRGTNRVPVQLLSNDPREIIDMAREGRSIPPVECECRQWRFKTREEALADGLVWPMPQREEDRETYFIGTATRHIYDKVQFGPAGKQWETYRLREDKEQTCNPTKCAACTGKGPAKCKPVTVMSFRLGAWGGYEPAFVHAESWATARRTNTFLFHIIQETGANLIGLEVDLVLDYTEPTRNPSGAHVRQPYWYVDIPWGMTVEEFRAAAIARGRRMLADAEELAEVHELQSRLLQERTHIIRRGALLPEFRPGLARLTAGDADTSPLTPTGEALVQDVMERTGKSQAEATLLVRSHEPEELDALLGGEVIDAESEEVADEPPAELLPEEAPEPEEPPLKDTPFEGDPDHPIPDAPIPPTLFPVAPRNVSSVTMTLTAAGATEPERAAMLAQAEGKHAAEPAVSVLVWYRRIAMAWWRAKQAAPAEEADPFA
jgi:hypothetical protein